MSDSKYVIVGMSGGVDSSVSAYLLLKAGFHVEGLFMRNWEEDESSNLPSACCADEDLNDARIVCQKLGIKLRTVNFATEYWDRVFSYFLDEYKSGRTPNPDVLCNKEIKFKAFLNYAMELGADFIATGHYAKIKKNGNSFELLKAADDDKDQSYFLYQLNQHQLSKAIFPVGDIIKSEVRNIAEEIGLRNYGKKDSTGICFIGERNFKQFLQNYLPAKPGNIISYDGKIIGKHDGLMYHTIGQRKGLGIGGLKNGKELPWYVVDKNLDNNELIVAQSFDHPSLFKKDLIAKQLHWVKSIQPQMPFSCNAKIRYRQKDQACDVKFIDNETILVTFDEQQRAVSPGQSVVFYDGDVCLGGGIIE